MCNGFSSPETVVLLQPEASEPSAWRQLLSCPSTCAPTRPAAPGSSPHSSPAAAAAATPSTHPDPASQLRRERRERRAKYLRKRGVPIRTALPSGGGQADRGGERKQRDRERKRSTRSGRGRSLRALPPLTPRSLPLAWAQVSLSPGLKPSAPLLCPYSCPHTRSIRPKPPALSSHLSSLSLSSLHRTTRN